MLQCFRFSIVVTQHRIAQLNLVAALCTDTENVLKNQKLFTAEPSVVHVNCKKNKEFQNVTWQVCLLCYVLLVDLFV